MSFYNMLFGMNSQTDLLLAVVGLKQVDVERFRDVSHDDGKQILVYTRTGGGNREGYPNLAMRHRPEWVSSVDDDYDSTYCTDTFAVPEQWQQDVLKLSSILKHGMRAKFARHLAKTLMRPATERDEAQTAYDSEQSALARTEHFKANGHTFVPRNDYAMEVALKCAEGNGGALRTCWGILPLQIKVKRDFINYPNAKREEDRKTMTRVDVSYEWKIDEAYWAHCVERWNGTYPIAMAKIAESVAQHLEQAAKVPA